MGDNRISTTAHPGATEQERQYQITIEDLKDDRDALRAQVETLTRELEQHREMDNARIAGFEAHESGTDRNDNPHSFYGPLEHLGRAWETGWLLAAGNDARAKLTVAECDLEMYTQHAEANASERVIAENHARKLTAERASLTARVAELERRSEFDARIYRLTSHVVLADWQRSWWSFFAGAWEAIGHHADLARMYSLLRDECATLYNESKDLTARLQAAEALPAAMIRLVEQTVVEWRYGIEANPNKYSEDAYAPIDTAYLIAQLRKLATAPTTPAAETGKAEEK